MTEPGSEDSGRARRQRLSEAEVRRRMLEKGRDLALGAGVGINLEDLSMEEIIQRALVPRSSVYRLWPYKDEFVDDLLCHLAGPDSMFGGQNVFDPETFSVVEKILSENADRIRTPAGRRAVVREIVRMAVERNYTAFIGNMEWRVHIALTATVGSSHRKARTLIAGQLEETQSRSRRSMVALIEHIATSLGMRLRDPERTIEHLVTSGSALIQGLALRNTLVSATAGDPDRTENAAVSDRLLNAHIPGPGLDGSSVDWSLAAFAYMALVDAHLEPDPDFTPPTGP